MELQTKAELIASIAERWRQQYMGPGNRWTNTGADKADTYRRLVAEQPQTEEAIVAIIGNRSWTDNKCDECGRDVPALVQLGERPDYDARYVFICPDCLRAALDMLK